MLNSQLELARIFNAPHPLTNFQRQKYQNEPKFNGVCSRNNLLKIKELVYVINSLSMNQ